MTDRQAGGSARESPICEQRANLAQTFGFQVARGIEHLLHARAAARPLVSDDHDVSGLYFAAEDRFHRRILTFCDHRGTPETQDARVDTGSLDDAAPLGEVAVEHGQPTVPAVGGFVGADATGLSVGVQLRIPAVLGEGALSANAGRPRAEELEHCRVLRTRHIP